MTSYYTIFRFVPPEVENGPSEWIAVSQPETEEEAISQVTALREDGLTYRVEYFNGLCSRILEV